MTAAAAGIASLLNLTIFTLTSKLLTQFHYDIFKHHQSVKNVPPIPEEYENNFAFDMTRGKGMNINVALVSAESDSLVDTSTASSYGSRAFRSKVHWKLIMLQQAVNQNVRVLYMDSDIILFKDPFPVLNSYKGYDIIAQRDSHICTGFMYLIPTLLTKQVLAESINIRLKLANADDQEAFNVAVQSNTSIKLLLLPDHLFSSGAVFFKKHSYYWDKIRKTQIMMHDNYIVGSKNKIYRLKELKLYKLDVDGEYSNPDAKYLTIEKCSTCYFTILFRYCK